MNDVATIIVKFLNFYKIIFYGHQPDDQKYKLGFR